MKHVRFAYLLASLSLVLAPACGGNGNGDPPGDGGNNNAVCGEANPADRVNQIIASSCAVANCHDDNTPSAGLDLLTPGFEERITNAAPTCGAAAVGPLLVPGDPNGSFIFDKLQPQPSCRSRMPLARAPLSDDDIACFEDWIADM